MLPSDQLETDLRQSLEQLARQPLVELLLQNGILRELAAGHLRRRLCDAVLFTADEQTLVISRLFEGVAFQPPADLQPGWIEALPPLLQGPLRDRWDQIRLQKWMEQTYRERIDSYFLERREDLEQVVYGMIRLRHQGVAEELYLRLLDDGADFGDLARQYSLGEERFTRGLVGPMRISQPHPTIRDVLQKLTIGELHPPFMVDNWILLVRMEHRQPAQLTDSTMLQLCQELMQQDLEATLDAQLQALYPALLQAYPAPLPIGGGPPEASAAASPAPPQSPAAAEPTSATVAPELPEGPETGAGSPAWPQASPDASADQGSPAASFSDQSASTVSATDPLASDQSTASPYMDAAQSGAGTDSNPEASAAATSVAAAQQPDAESGHQRLDASPQPERPSDPGSHDQALPRDQLESDGSIAQELAANARINDPPLEPQPLDPQPPEPPSLGGHPSGDAANGGQPMGAASIVAEPIDDQRIEAHPSAPDQTVSEPSVVAPAPGATPVAPALPAATNPPDAAADDAANAAGEAADTGFPANADHAHAQNARADGGQTDSPSTDRPGAEAAAAAEPVGEQASPAVGGADSPSEHPSTAAPLPVVLASAQASPSQENVPSAETRPSAAAHHAAKPPPTALRSPGVAAPGAIPPQTSSAQPSSAQLGPASPPSTPLQIALPKIVPSEPADPAPSPESTADVPSPAASADTSSERVVQSLGRSAPANAPLPRFGGSGLKRLVRVDSAYPGILPPILSEQMPPPDDQAGDSPKVVEP